MNCCLTSGGLLNLKPKSTTQFMDCPDRTYVANFWLIIRNPSQGILSLEDLLCPTEISGIPGPWLYCEGPPRVHIEARSQGRLRADEFIEHIAFRMGGGGDYDMLKAKLEHLGIAYNTTEIPSLNEQCILTYSRWAVDGNRFP